jgi:hypothetical protein
MRLPCKWHVRPHAIERQCSRTVVHLCVTVSNGWCMGCSRYVPTHSRLRFCYPFTLFIYLIVATSINTSRSSNHSYCSYLSNDDTTQWGWVSVHPNSSESGHGCLALMIQTSGARHILEKNCTLSWTCSLYCLNCSWHAPYPSMAWRAELNLAQFYCLREGIDFHISTVKCHGNTSPL